MHFGQKAVDNTRAVSDFESKQPLGQAQPVLRVVGGFVVQYRPRNVGVDLFRGELYRARSRI